MPNSKEPKLDPPGAGLPAPMLFIAKRVSSLRAKLGSSSKFLTEFNDEKEKIEQLVLPLSLEQRSQRVLIPRLIGLEDSSRYYSVWMTLDHLRICNFMFAVIIKDLSEEKLPDIKVSTADVKPDPDVIQRVEKEYDIACKKFLSTMKRIKEIKSESQLEHPWFGQLDAHRWLSLSAFHMKIHRRQIAAIIKRL